MSPEIKFDDSPPIQAPVQGRLLALEDPLRVYIQTRLGVKEVILSQAPEGTIKVGDVVEAVQGKLKLLTPNLKGTTQFHQHVRDPRRVQALKTRQQVENGIREFFTDRDFLETRTPLLVPCPGMEPHIRPFKLSGSQAFHAPVFLPTSPEFAMKKLLVGGLERIFQICPAFRDEPRSVTHLPEFTLLEWYRAFATYEDIMKDVESLVYELVKKVHQKDGIEFQGKEILFTPPWPRLRVRDLFQEFAEIELTENQSPEQLAQHCSRLGLKCDPKKESWDDLYFKIWLNIIEPKLPADRPVFVTRYPASQAALSVIDQDPDGTRWARRFEVYAGGLELGNAFEELTDPIEQRRRFVKDMELRTEVYGAGFAKNPLDEDFLAALSEGMPPSGGIAMGVDRLIQLLCNESDIDYTFWFSASDSSATAR